MFKWLKDWGEEVKDKFQAVVPGYFGGGWYSEGVFTDPLAGVILADTEALAAGIYKIVVHAGSTVALSATGFMTQHRNAANDTTIQSQSFGIHTHNTHHVLTLTIKVRENERFRVVTLGNLTVVVHCSINAIRLYPLKRGQ